MVYLEPHQLGWRPLLTSWIAQLPTLLGQRAKTTITGLFDWLMPVSLKFMKRECKEQTPTEDTNLAQACMRLMQSLMDEFVTREEDNGPPAGGLR